MINLMLSFLCHPFLGSVPFNINIKILQETQQNTQMIRNGLKDFMKTYISGLFTSPFVVPYGRKITSRHV